MSNEISEPASDLPVLADRASIVKAPPDFILWSLAAQWNNQMWPYVSQPQTNLDEQTLLIGWGSIYLSSDRAFGSFLIPFGQRNAGGLFEPGGYAAMAFYASWIDDGTDWWGTEVRGECRIPEFENPFRNLMATIRLWSITPPWSVPVYLMRESLQENKGETQSGNPEDLGNRGPAFDKQFHGTVAYKLAQKGIPLTKVLDLPQIEISFVTYKKYEERGWIPNEPPDLRADIQKTVDEIFKEIPSN